MEEKKKVKIVKWKKKKVILYVRKKKTLKINEIIRCSMWVNTTLKKFTNRDFDDLLRELNSIITLYLHSCKNFLQPSIFFQFNKIILPFILSSTKYLRLFLPFFLHNI